MTDSRQQEGGGSVPHAFLNAKRPDAIEHNAYVKNMGNTTSFRKAINAMCAHCMGCTEYHMEPGYKQEIKNCTSTVCPLWHFRPYQEKKA